VPSYGTEQWALLDTRDPRWWAALVVAAECWRKAGTEEELGRQFADEVVAAQQPENMARDAEFPAVAAFVRSLTYRSDHAELVRRRHERVYG
jgi:hypothetical protein